jgi:hypothetical protein
VADLAVKSAEGIVRGLQKLLREAELTLACARDELAGAIHFPGCCHDPIVMPALSPSPTPQINSRKTTTHIETNASTAKTTPVATSTPMVGALGNSDEIIKPLSYGAGRVRMAQTTPRKKKKRAILTEKAFECNICGRTFRLRKQLRDHLVKVHHPPFKYVCHLLTGAATDGYCTFSSSYVCNFKAHVGIFHSVAQAAEAKANPLIYRVFLKNNSGPPLMA